MDDKLQFLENEEIVKVVVQNDVFDVFTRRKVCLRFDLATSELLREISFDVQGFGDEITQVQYFEKQDSYLIISSKNFLIGDFVYGLKLIDEIITTLDIKKDHLAFATKDRVVLYHYPELTEQARVSLSDINDICFVNEDREIFVVTQKGNYIIESNSMELRVLKELPSIYRELRYKNDFIIGIKEHSIDFIEEDILEVSLEYHQMSIPDELLTAVKLCDDEVYVILGGSLGGVEIFNIETNELFFKGKLVDGCSIETIHMDMEYQSVLIYTKEKGIEIHPFVDFV